MKSVMPCVADEQPGGARVPPVPRGERRLAERERERRRGLQGGARRTTILMQWTQSARTKDARSVRKPFRQNKKQDRTNSLWKTAIGTWDIEYWHTRISDKRGTEDSTRLHVGVPSIPNTCYHEFM